MIRGIPAICVLLVMAAASSNAIAGSSACGLPAISGERELNQFLSLRAVQVVRLAASSDKGLAALVSSSASFSTGGSDVGLPMGTGVEGARKLAQHMKADTYRFLGWDYMDMPTDACAKHKVEVEFIDSQNKLVSQLKFEFDAGKVVSVDGWGSSFETGRL